MVASPPAPWPRDCRSIASANSSCITVPQQSCAMRKVVHRRQHNNAAAQQAKACKHQTHTAVRRALTSCSDCTNTVHARRLVSKQCIGGSSCRAGHLDHGRYDGCDIARVPQECCPPRAAQERCLVDERAARAQVRAAQRHQRGLVQRALQCSGSHRKRSVTIHPPRSSLSPDGVTAARPSRLATGCNMASTPDFWFA